MTTEKHKTTGEVSCIGNKQIFENLIEDEDESKVCI